MSTTVTLQELLDQALAIGAKLDATLHEIGALVNAHVATIGISVSTLTGGHATIQPVVTSGPVAPVSLPAAFPGAGSPVVRQVIAQSASAAGLREEVLEAIERWETGNYKNPEAGAWIHGFNPGGMKFNAETATAIGALPDPYISAVSKSKYAKFPSWNAGILGHGLFLRHSNYDAARQQSTTDGQIQAIWDAGYCEYDEEWRVEVKRIAKSLPPLQQGDPLPPAGVPSDELARARSAIGKGITYSQDTEGTDRGDDPTLPLPGYHHPDGTWTCDCSEYGAWVKRYRRANKWNTATIKGDAHGSQTCFSVVPKGSAVAGDQANYYDAARSTGHHGYVSQVSAGMVTHVIHCHSGQAPAIQETPWEGSPFQAHNADIVRYHGPVVA